MRPGDTAPEVQKRMDEHYRRMTPAEKAEAVRDAWNTARTLALAGLRLDHPGESDEQLEARWAERRLGRALFGRALARPRSAKR
jgi:hypothetical protein